MRGLQKIDRVKLTRRVVPRQAIAKSSASPPSLTGGDENAAKSLFIQALRLTMSIIRDRKNGPGLRRTCEPAFCQQRIILSGLGFRGSYAIHFRVIFVVIYCIVVCVLGCLYCLFSPRNPKHVATFGHLFGRLSPVFGLKVELRKPADAESYGNAIYIANHQNNYDMVTASNIVQAPTVTVGKKPAVDPVLWPTVLADR